MKQLTMAIFLLTFSVGASAKTVPLDILTGLWEYTTDMSKNKMMEAALASVPESQKEMVKKMMQQNAPKPVKNCMTQEELNDPESHFKKGAAKNKKMKDCKMIITKSTKKKFIGQLKCPDKSTTFSINVTVINKKEMDTVIKGGMFGEIKSKAKWLKADCK
ncbi:MAG: hypothetical protein CME70_16855 [Halobacteriovorax sp.]|nr:hypothetical protein [Halobacteriovorax sp.]|tara:strand:- start:158178 stop:158660 length:483 start_codon:yes stop_codon:yes gene_type:complete